MLLDKLIGTWRGEGAGEYPTIEPFKYTEELTIVESGKPFLNYRQRTWSPAGDPMHTEVGFLRGPSVDSVEFIIAQPTGQTELLEGVYSETAAGFRLELHGRIMNSATAKQVDATRRIFEFTRAGTDSADTDSPGPSDPGNSSDVLTYDFAMAAVGVEMTHHLSATLRRVEQ